MGFLRAFFDNESRFGQLMTRCGILIGANLTFLLFCVPVITVGPAWTALHYTMLRTLREKEINPFAVFWQGFRDNWKQSLIMELILVPLVAFLLLESFWCSQMQGFVHNFLYGVAALLFITLVIGIYLFPVTAAFEGSLSQRIRNSVYFAVKSIPNMLIILFVHIVPMAITYLDNRRMPLYAFIWFFAGFSSVAMVTAGRLLPMFAPYLNKEDRTDPDTSDEKILGEMLELGM